MCQRMKITKIKIVSKNEWQKKRMFVQYCVNDTKETFRKKLKMTQRESFERKIQI